MLHRLINLSPDLNKLVSEGFSLETKNGYLLVHDIPYVNSERKLLRGVLVIKLDLAEDKTVQPESHEAFFVGEIPCDSGGKPLMFVIGSDNRTLSDSLTVNHHFSAKPPSGRYIDYYEKVTVYASLLSGPAEQFERGITPKTFRPVVPDDDESIFNYLDSNSSRAEIIFVSQKLENLKIGIIGLGGTGSYVLDFVAKTWVKEIHLFDGDILLQHNAFRMPGAATSEEVGKKSKKVHHHTEVYSKLRKNIFPHEYGMDESKLEELLSLDFIFICIDKSEDKKAIIATLTEKQIPFIDVGMGVQLVNDELRGSLRTTLVSPNKQDHIDKNIPLSDEGNEEYAQNIQLAELNALNAAIAVIKWKKYYGFYHDFENEHNSIYNIDVNQLVNEDVKP